MTDTTYIRWLRIAQGAVALLVILISGVLAWAALDYGCRENKAANVRQDQRIEKLERRLDTLGVTLHRMDRRQATILEKVNQLERDP